MKYLYAFSLGLLTSSIIGGLWWLFMFSGIVALIAKRSYIVMFTGVLLDLVFAALGTYWLYVGFYTIVFLITTIVVEFLRERVLWAS
tara:strand:- start:13729 stop:13989 length:261 start_codon:yes stop_codon:yes gene_type:complete